MNRQKHHRNLAAEQIGGCARRPFVRYMHDVQAGLLEIDDLLGRDSVTPDAALMEKNIRGKTVLVTGAGGSIGSELCRQLLACGPARLLLLDLNEYALYAIHRELERAEADSGRTGTKLVPLLASVLYQGLPASERQGVHRRLAGLAEDPLDVLRVIEPLGVTTDG